MKKKVTSVILSADDGCVDAGSECRTCDGGRADQDRCLDLELHEMYWVLSARESPRLSADALGVEVQYVDQGHVSEKVTASVDQLCAAGCQGIVICNSADTEMTSAIATCDSNGVYLAQFFRIISEEANPDIYELAKASEYGTPNAPRVGAVHENEPENGEKLVEHPPWQGSTQEHRPDRMGAGRRDMASGGDGKAIRQVLMPV